MDGIQISGGNCGSYIYVNIPGAILAKYKKKHLEALERLTAENIDGNNRL